MMATKTALARTIWDRTRAIDLSLVGVLTLAACLRWVYIGMYQLVGDEAILLYSALRLGRHGQWTWLTLNVTSWSFLPGHSPFSVYLIAIPYLFSPDPRLARLWVGLLAIVGIAVMYWVMRRYFGQTAALMTGLLLAAHVPLTDWSRFVWNANLAQPFIAGWLLTGLLGYYEGKRWAQALHWLALSCAIQAHPGNVLLAPLSLFLVTAGWIQHRSERRALVRATLLGWAIFAASLVPWGIG
ncbi:MAG TPA: glycosyltransferase family 39 protein, partial [Anaerolineales bacterium]|nr:glycosyltransferase family 39 protein [Anaerolineales bacterium]